MKPTSGSIVLDGKPIVGPRPDVGIVFQQATLMPWRTVLDNVLLPIRTLRRDIDAGRETAHQLPEDDGAGSFREALSVQSCPAACNKESVSRAVWCMIRRYSADGRAFCRARRHDARAHDARTTVHLDEYAEIRRLYYGTASRRPCFSRTGIIVLSARPGRMIKDVVVDLPRPRTLETMGERKFVNLCNELRALFDDLVKFD